MSAATCITVRVPLSIRKRGGRKVIMAPDGFIIPSTPRPTVSAAQPSLLKALARAFRWKKMLDEGRYVSISEIAIAEKIDRGYVGSILRLTLLAPDIVQTIVDGRQPPGLGLPALLKPFPLEWERQRTRWSVVTDISAPPTRHSG